MSKFDWKSVCILCLPLLGLIFSVACDSKRATDEKRSLVLLEDDELLEAQSTNVDYTLENGKVDIAKLTQDFTEEARKNWSETSLQGTYLRINNSLRHVDIAPSEEVGGYSVVTNQCLFEGFKDDNSQPETWTIGSSEDCRELLVKSKKVGNVYLIQLKGLEGSFQIVRAAVIEQTYTVSEAVPKLEKHQSVATILKTTEFKFRASKVFLPPQIETNRNRGMSLSHSLFELPSEPWEPGSEEWVSLVTEGFTKTSAYQSLVDGNAPVVEFRFHRIQMDIPEEGFSFLASAKEMLLRLNFEEEIDWRNKYHDIDVRLEVKPVEAPEKS